MRRLWLALPLLFAPLPPAAAQVQVGVGVVLPGVSIGIHLPAYPRLVPVPGYPVYYAPGVAANLFFYDGLYWVYAGDAWYASAWYNGPWRLIAPIEVPAYVLQVPVRYYRVPPPYFRAWRADAPPRWNEHWGRDWSHSRRGWDRRDPRHVPAPAPRPEYQRDYAGDRYPRDVDRQRAISAERYRYVPHESVLRADFAARPAPIVQPAAVTPPRREGSDSPGRGRGETRGDAPNAGAQGGQGKGRGHGRNDD